MPPVASALFARFASYPALSRRDCAALIITAMLHAAALVIMASTEPDLESKATFLFAWLLLNFFWLAVLRRPAIAALLSLALFVTLILLSQFKYDKLMMTVNFVDVMILDRDTIAFFLTIYPDLLRRVILAACVTIPVFAFLWWLALPRRRHRHMCRGPDGAARSLLGRRLCVEIRQFRCRCDRGLRHARLYGIGRRCRRQIPSRCRRRLQACRQATAYYPDP